jgi:glucan 1,3-beta-glucosidase
MLGEQGIITHQPGPPSSKVSSRPSPAPPSLINSGSARFYSRSKPQYETVPVPSFLSIRDAGAVGDGIHDDTSALHKILKRAASQKKIVFFDAGTYKVTSTINVPAGSKIVGEAYPVIMGSGRYFSNIPNLRVVVRTGGTSTIEWPDIIVSTQGPTAGAILIQWDTDFDHLYVDNKPSGMWDVHVRIAGFSASNLQVNDCPTSTDPVSKPYPKCIAAFMGMHVSRDGAGLYMENVWIWTADHDIDDPDLKRITVYTGRGFLDESKFGSLWL